MHQNQRIIMWLKEEYGEGNDNVKIVIAALEKQIPKNWIAEYIGDGDFIWKCPSCNEKFVLLDGTPQDNKYNHCPNCGQALAERRSDEE